MTGIVLVALFAAEMWRRQALYWYDVRRDYAYEFNGRSSVALPVQLSRDALTLPPRAEPRDTALLELRVAARWSGRWFVPCIEVTAGGDTGLQCFERGAKGVRYLLVHLPPDGSAQEIRLRGRHLRWEPQTARVVLFDTPDLANARMLVLAPHPDDAEIAAFGLYSSHDSYVATLTAGNYVDGLYGNLQLDTAAQDELRGEVRTWDSLAVPQLGGVTADRVVNLGYLTHSLRTFHQATREGSNVPSPPVPTVGRYRRGALQALLKGRAATATWESVVADLVALIQSTRPDVIVAPHPALDIAPDHQFTTIAALEALEALKDQTTALLLYTNHHTLAEHYPFGPSNSMVTLPPWFGGTRFDGIYSHRLDAQDQLRKLFALESMHDLRAPPSRVDGGPTGVLLQRVGEGARIVRRDPFGDYSYFRRAVRPNELFFLYGPDARPSSAEFVAELNRSTPP